jgi:hypothetical protein
MIGLMEMGGGAGNQPQGNSENVVFPLLRRFYLWVEQIAGGFIQTNNSAQHIEPLGVLIM